MARIDVDRERLTAFRRRRHIRKPALFGSVLRDGFRLDSDIDVPVKFEPGRVPGFSRLAGTEFEPSALPDGRKVDPRTPKEPEPVEA